MMDRSPGKADGQGGLQDLAKERKEGRKGGKKERGELYKEGRDGDLQTR
jgi:hypothetical protein